MGRLWQRLVACVSVATFLVPNAHGGMAVAVLAHTEPVTCVHGCDGDDSDDDADHDHGPCDASCPDADCPNCPKAPTAPKCPCPGGCAWCSIAKVPCLTCLARTPNETPQLGDRIGDLEPLYTSPNSGPRARPPRA